MWGFFILGQYMIITNKNDIPLPLAVWLLGDNYDYQKDPNYISATGLLKPLKQIVMLPKVDSTTLTEDLENFIPRVRGTALHDGIEKAWLDNNYKQAMAKLGLSDAVIARMKVNPKPEELTKDTIPIYIEQRTKRMIDGFTVGGKFDFVASGVIYDFKSTSAYTWVYGTKDEDYKLQGSIYRWLNPDKITEDYIRICFIFTDWQSSMVAQNPKYPKHSIMYKDIPLMSLEETEAWIKNKLKDISKYLDKDESEIPECSDEELWRKEDSFKYYKNPDATRATKVFTNLADANQFWQVNMHGVGEVRVVKGEVKRCQYCDIAPICKQRKKYFND